MKQYDKQFKDQAVNLVLDLGRPVKKVAEELGIHENTLYCTNGSTSTKTIMSMLSLAAVISARKMQKSGVLRKR